MKEKLSLPKGWELKTIGDVCVSASSNVSQNKLADDEGEYPIFGASGLIKKVSFYHRDKPYLSIVKDGSGVGRVTKMDAYTSVIGTLQYILPKENIDLDYLNYSLMSVDFKKYVAGAAIPHIYFKDYKNEPFLWMPLPEQQRIVSILDECFATIDKAKANAEQNLKNAKELFESYLQGVFENKGDGWEEMSLGEFATFRNGMNFTKSSKGDEIRIVGVKDFQDNFWVPFDELESVVLDGNLNEIDELKENDIIAVRSNGNPALIGRTLLAGEVEGKISHSGFTIRIRLNSTDKVLPIYLCRYLKTQKTRRELVEKGNGVGIKSLNQGSLSSLVIPYPKALKEQQAIVRQLDALRAETQKLEAIYQKKMKDLEELKKSILQKAFTGELKTEKDIKI
jgi:type I restriction enzyme, S subunit